MSEADARTRETLNALRELVLEAGREAGVGEISESVKWGQPSFTPKKPRTGSSVRLGVTNSGGPALFFICHARLVDRFRERYGDVLQFEGDRAIVPDPGKPLEEAALKHCIAMAFTYHRDKP